MIDLSVYSFFKIEKCCHGISITNLRQLESGDLKIFVALNLPQLSLRCWMC